MNLFTQIPTASNRTRVLKISQKASFIVKGTKCDQFSNYFPKCMIKPKKFYEKPIEMTGKRSVKTNLITNNEKRHHNCHYSSCGYVEQNLSNLQLLLKFQPHRTLYNVLKNLTIMMTIYLLSQLI